MTDGLGALTRVLALSAKLQPSFRTVSKQQTDHEQSCDPKMAALDGVCRRLDDLAVAFFEALDELEETRKKYSKCCSEVCLFKSHALSFALSDISTSVDQAMVQVFSLFIDIIYYVSIQHSAVQIYLYIPVGLLWVDSSQICHGC